MSILNRIANTLFSGKANEAYTTVVYPTRGRPVIIHDGLGIHQQRPWYEAASETHNTMPEVQDSFPCAELSNKPEVSDSNDHGGLFSRASVIEVAADPADNFVSGMSGSHAITMVEPLEIYTHDTSCDFNPATGMAMIGGGFDVGGNAFGFSG